MLVYMWYFCDPFVFLWIELMYVSRNRGGGFFFILAPLPFEDQLKSATLYQVPYRAGEYRQKGKTSPSSQIVHSLSSKGIKRIRK